jgi:predicted HAD superfamily phosphohydrolase YqeG
LSKTYLDYYDVSPSLNLLESNVRDLLFKYIIEHEIKFVVLDNLFSLWAGIDLDNAREWNASNQWLLKLRSKNVSVMILHHTNKSKKQMGTASKYFNINTALILEKTTPQRKNHEDEEIASFSIKVDKQRMKGGGLSGNTFTCDDGIWTVEDRKETKALDIVLLLLDGKKKQSEISNIVMCNKSYVTKVKKSKEFEHLFNEDGSPNSEGKQFLEKHQDDLSGIYESYDYCRFNEC